MADGVPVKAEASIKAEEDGASPMALDEDIYEDAGDLEFYDANLPNNPQDAVYFARVPTYLYQAWQKLEDKGEIQIATVRSWEESDPKDPQKKKPRMRLLLRSDLASHQGLAKEYELELTDMSGGHSRNAFVFTEEDLPSFKAKNRARAEATAAGIPAHLLRQKDREKDRERGEKPNQQHGRRGRHDFYRKAIPKKTAVYGRVRHDMQVTPVQNPESEAFLNRRANEAMTSRAQVKFGNVARSNDIRILGGQGLASHMQSQGFIKTAPAPVPKAKKMDLKTARMPENDLLDLIFRCFERYRYWSMKSLRAEIPQPEIYLRQTLEKVADLHRSGTFANNWELKHENRKAGSAVEQKKASDELAEAVDSDPDGDEDADVKMEDVM